MTSNEFRIENKIVGNAQAPFLIAEAGVHHNNSLSLAKQLILEARISGVDSIKFQTYKADKIAAKWAPTYWDSGSSKTQFDIFSERSLLTDQDYESLMAYCRELGIIFLSTPFDLDSASFLNELGMAAFKVASADLTNYPLLRHIASFKKPMILSTGAAYYAEIADALQQLKKFDVPISLLHCSLSYPTPVAAANLLRISELQKRFGECVIGYSDHTQPQDSELVCPLAVGLGARVIEKHFTLNKFLLDDDHYHAVDPQGLSRLVKNCREAFLMTTNCQEITEHEQAARKFARRSIVAARPLSAGHVITFQDIDFKRPGTGVSPTQSDQYIGRKLKRDVNGDELIMLEDLA